jgi:hypothetical protein
VAKKIIGKAAKTADLNIDTRDFDRKKITVLAIVIPIGTSQQHAITI